MSERIGGRFVSKAQFERRRKCSTLLQGRHRTEKRNEAEYVQNVGRRIVDIQLLAEAMWCDTCDVPLSFRFMEKEVQRGLASVFSIRCKTCYEVKEVMSSSQVHTSSGAFYPVYTINCKAALGCLDSGIAHEQFNCCLTAMNIPPITRSTMKRAESRVAPAVVAVAEESCKNAVQQEKELTVSLG